MITPSHNPESSASLRALADALGLLFVETVPDSLFSPELSGRLPVSWARTAGLLPVEIDGVPSLLTSDPADLEAHQKAALAVGSPLQTVVAPAAAIASAIERCYAATTPAPTAEAEKSPAADDAPPAEEEIPADGAAN
ncbi:MAG: hypothetical protein IJQ73_16620, partial [Kiritimatiellae bacterium]|nr:hypothetical protein [Kiritimatiellia bacterium]